MQDHSQTPSLRECLKTFFLLAKPQLSKPKLDIPKLGLGNEEILYNHETMSSHFLEIVTEYAV